MCVTVCVCVRMYVHMCSHFQVPRSGGEVQGGAPLGVRLVHVPPNRGVVLRRLEVSQLGGLHEVGGGRDLPLGSEESE